jgi:UDP-N-acetylglucosamine 2-epimerase (non-hydrolysing)
MYEVITYYLPAILQSDVLKRLALEPGRFFVVSAHREENVDDKASIRKLSEILNAVAEKYDFPVIVSTHPRTRKRIEELGLTFDHRVQLLKPLGFTDYVRLQKDAYAVLSDSGTINEESSILNFRALNLREAHERPEGMEEAAVMMPGLELDRVMQCLNILHTQPVGSERLLRQVTDYSMPNVSEKVVRIIHSYTDYVNRVIWKKHA